VKNMLPKLAGLPGKIGLCSQLNISLPTKGIHEMLGTRRAKPVLYQLGRSIGRELGSVLEKEHGFKKANGTDALFANIEKMGHLFFGCRISTPKNSGPIATLRIFDSPGCAGISQMPEPCCDYIAGVIASFSAYQLGGVPTSCIEISCRGCDPTLPCCEFELLIGTLK
jgi:predicted hydrocarbon binding protein